MVREDESNEPIIKMRGLPWSATVDDIIKFLGMRVKVHNLSQIASELLTIDYFTEEANIKSGRAGVHITMSKEGRPSGEAFIELETIEDMEKALKKDKQHMGHRYIESKYSNFSDLDFKYTILTLPLLSI